MPPAIRVEGLGKRFALEGHAARSLRDDLAALARAPLRWLPGGAAPAPEPLWALRDVTFSVEQGDVVGVIGRNGAGKSTLLKLLARITAPSEGGIDLHGRVGALLEVGTGFHPDLTGRENVFLSGVILGLTRAEVRRRFEEIVAFAEVGRFLDEPVKHYSTGMRMRLAFAVAAHLEPEVLLIDEVLAVGDARFQRKCLDRVEGVARAGRTVVFVSHDLGAVQRLCRRALILEGGRLVFDGPVEEAVVRYLQDDAGVSAAREWPPDALPGDDVARLRALRVRDPEGRVSERHDIRRPVAIEVEWEVLAPGHLLTPNVHVFDARGQCVFVTNDLTAGWRDTPRPVGVFASTVTIPGNFLAEGRHLLGAAVSTLDPLRIHAFERDVAAFEVADTLDGDSARGRYGGVFPGAVRPLLPWTTREVAP